MEKAKLLMECNPEGIMAQLAVGMKSPLAACRPTDYPPGRPSGLQQTEKVQFFTASNGADVVR